MYCVSDRNTKESSGCQIHQASIQAGTSTNPNDNWRGNKTSSVWNRVYGQWKASVWQPNLDRWKCYGIAPNRTQEQNLPEYRYKKSRSFFFFLFYSLSIGSFRVWKSGSAVLSDFINNRENWSHRASSAWVLSSSSTVLRWLHAWKFCYKAMSNQFLLVFIDHMVRL